jgi:hypothetical protein
MRKVICFTVELKYFRLTNSTTNRKFISCFKQAKYLVEFLNLQLSVALVSLSKLGLILPREN